MIHYFGENGKGLINEEATEARAVRRLLATRAFQMESPAEGRAFRDVDGRTV
jgi:hypothetical protein